MLIHTEPRRRFEEDGVDSGQQKRTESTMAEGLTNLTKNLKQNTERVNGVTLFHAHVILPCS